MNVNVCVCRFPFYNYKLSPHILCQHRVLRNLRKNKHIVIMKPNKGNEVVILDKKLYDNYSRNIYNVCLRKFQGLFLIKNIN